MHSGRLVFSQLIEHLPAKVFRRCVLRYGGDRPVQSFTCLDLRGHIPAFIHISEAKLHEVNVLDLLVPEPAAFYVMDRAYEDFKVPAALLGRVRDAIRRVGPTRPPRCRRRGPTRCRSAPKCA